MIFPNEIKHYILSFLPYHKVSKISAYIPKQCLFNENFLHLLSENKTERYCDEIIKHNCILPKMFLETETLIHIFYHHFPSFPFHFDSTPNPVGLGLSSGLSGPKSTHLDFPFKILYILVLSGLDENRKNMALLSATNCGNLENVQFLIKRAPKASNLATKLEGFCLSSGPRPDFEVGSSHDPSIFDCFGKPLMNAAENGYVDIVKVLIEAYEGTESIWFRRYCLMSTTNTIDAASRTSIDDPEFELKSKISIDESESDFELLSKTSVGRLKVIKYLLDYLKPNTIQLQSILENSSLYIIKYLVKNGLNISECINETLMNAVKNNHEKTKYFIQYKKLVI